MIDLIVLCWMSRGWKLLGRHDAFYLDLFSSKHRGIPGTGVFMLRSRDVSGGLE